MKIRRSPIRDWTRSLVAVGCLSALSFAQASAASAPVPTPTDAGQKPAEAAKKSQSDEVKFMRFVRAAAKGAKVRNIYDAQGVVVGNIPAEGLLAVYGERAGWLEVEAPEGMQVWVYGEYVRATNDPGLLEITGDNVHMRPLPSRETDAMPLKQALRKGEKVRLIGRKDVALDLSKDWVNVWSPVGTRAWVAASETEALPAGSDGAALWAAAVSRARKLSGATPATSPTSDGKPVQAASGAQEPRSVSEALDVADRKLADARAAAMKGSAPDIEGVRQAYQGVLAMSPSEAVRSTVQDRLRTCDAVAELWAMTVQLEDAKTTNAALQKQREDEFKKATERLSPDARFDGRGWLTKRNYIGADAPVYVLVFGNDVIAEVRCTSGRFDLEDFVDCEIGFNGTQASGPTRSAQPGQSRAASYDVSRIEVIALRAAKKN